MFDTTSKAVVFLGEEQDHVDVTKNCAGFRGRFDGARRGLAARDTDSDDPVLPADAPAVQQQPAEEPKPVRALKLTVVSKADKSSLPGATVWVRTQGGRVHTWEGTTDGEGRYTVVAPTAATGGFDISIASAGYALGGLRSSVGVTNHTLALEPANTIGGTVRDEHGRPIEGARVFATSYPFAIIWPEMYTSPNSEVAIATTDAQGRWQSNALPTDTRPETRVRVLVTHPDHINAEFGTTVEKARASSSEQVMKTGRSVAGQVLSPFGRPVAGATVVVGVQPWAGLRPWEGMYLRLATDRDGQFRTGRCIDPLHPKAVLIVQSSGLATAAREIIVMPETPPQVIQLTRRRPIAGRVVDSQAQPVAGAAVVSSPYAFNGLLDWDAETDDHGRFVWYDAPTTETVLLNVFKPPFRPTRGIAVEPEKREVTITVRSP